MSRFHYTYSQTRFKNHDSLSVKCEQGEISVWPPVKSNFALIFAFPFLSISHHNSPNPILLPDPLLYTTILYGACKFLQVLVVCNARSLPLFLLLSLLLRNINAN